MAKNEISLNMADVMRQVTVSVRLDGCRAVRWRLNLGTMLFRLAAFVAGVGVQIDVGGDGGNDDF